MTPGDAALLAEATVLTGAPSGTRSTQGGVRVLHLLVPAPFGGLEQVVLSLASAQAAAGYDVHVALVLEPAAADHPMLPLLDARGVQPYALLIPPRMYARERRLVRALCTSLRPDLVHTHGARADVLHAPVARTLRIPTVSTAHGFCGGDWKNRLYEALQVRSQRRCSAVVAVSAPMAAQLVRAGLAPGRVHCVPNAWTEAPDFLSRAEARVALGIPTDAFCAGFVGRLGAEKGPDLLLEALAPLGDAVHAVYIGDGRLRPALEQRARELALQDTVRMAGAVPGAARLIRAFDVVVLSSRTEGTPVVLLEAMAAGVPVIATRVGGIPDVVSAGEALLIDPEDTDALSDALREVLRTPAAAATRATQARQRLAREHGAAGWLAKYDHVYQTCGVRVAGSREGR